MKDKESIMIEVLNHLKKKNVTSAIEVIKSINDPLSAAWVGIGVWFVISDDEISVQFRNELDKAS